MASLGNLKCILNDLLINIYFNLHTFQNYFKQLFKTKNTFLNLIFNINICLAFKIEYFEYLIYFILYFIFV